MSRLSNKLQLAISPTAVGMISGGRRATLNVQAATDHDADQSPDGWLEALQALLQDAPANKTAQIVFSHSIAPVWQCPAPPVRLNEDDLAGWVNDQSMEKFGQSATDWRLTWDRPPPGTPIWVSGIAQDLIDSLTAQLKQKSITLECAEPWLTASAAKCAKAFGRRNTWLACAEPGRITLAGFKNAEPHLLRSIAFDENREDAATALGNMLAREALLDPDFNPKQIWIRSFGLPAHWQDLAKTHDLTVHASLVPDLDVTEMLER